MRWSKTTLRNSFFGWLAPTPAPVIEPTVGLEDIRHAMLSGLLDQDRTHYTTLERRLIRAKDIQTLWYLRSELMHALSEHRGESHAKAQLDDITRMFDGLVSPGLVPRSGKR